MEMSKIAAELRTLSQIVSNNLTSGSSWLEDDENFKWQWGQFDSIRHKLQEIDQDYFGDIREIKIPTAKANYESKKFYFRYHLTELNQEILRVINLLAGYLQSQNQKTKINDPVENLHQIARKFHSITKQMPSLPILVRHKYVPYLSS